jgi:hypothetical protein
MHEELWNAMSVKGVKNGEKAIVNETHTPILTVEKKGG